MKLQSEGALGDVGKTGWSVGIWAFNRPGTFKQMMMGATLSCRGELESRSELECWLGLSADFDTFLLLFLISEHL